MKAFLQPQEPLEVEIRGAPPLTVGLGDVTVVHETTYDKHYKHRQDVASAVWEINHNLGKYPSVSVVDSGGSVVAGDVEYTGLNSLIISFNAVFSGVAYMN